MASAIAPSPMPNAASFSPPSHGATTSTRFMGKILTEGSPSRPPPPRAGGETPPPPPPPPTAHPRPLVSGKKFYPRFRRPAPRHARGVMRRLPYTSQMFKWFRKSHQALNPDEDFILLTWDSCRY